MYWCTSVEIQKSIEQDAALERHPNRSMSQSWMKRRPYPSCAVCVHAMKPITPLKSMNQRSSRLRSCQRYVQGRVSDKAIDLLEKHSAVRMQKTLKPEDLDAVDRRVAQLTKERDQVKKAV